MENEFWYSNFLSHKTSRFFKPQNVNGIKSLLLLRHHIILLTVINSNIDTHYLISTIQVRNYGKRLWTQQR